MSKRIIHHEVEIPWSKICLMIREHERKDIPPAHALIRLKYPQGYNNETGIKMDTSDFSAKLLVKWETTEED